MANISYIEIRGSSTVNIYNDTTPATIFTGIGGVKFYTGVVHYDDGTTSLVSDPDNFSFSNPDDTIEIDGPFRDTIQVTLRAGGRYFTFLNFSFGEFSAAVPIWRDYVTGFEVTPSKVFFQSDYDLTKPAQVWFNGFTATIAYTVSAPDWITISDKTSTGFNITASENTAKTGRSGTIIVVLQSQYDGSYYNLTKTISVSQLGVFNIVPIWKDLPIEELQNDVSYTLTAPESGNVIYKGRAIGFDGTTVYLNKLMSSYMPKNEFPTTTGVSDIKYSKKVNYKSYNNNLNYEFINNWSYDSEELGDFGTYLLSKPISRKLFRGYNFIATFKEGMTYKPEGVASPYLASANDYANLFTPVGNTPCRDFVVRSPKENREIVYTIVDPRDNSFVLYYVNKYGGWDQLCVEGNVTQVDNINRYNYKQWNPWVNNTNYPRGNTSYLTEYTPKWTLQTGYIFGGPVDMGQLLESNNVVLFDGKRYIPVVIDDTSVIYKTYRNSGNKAYNYTINVSQSMPQINM